MDVNEYGDGVGWIRGSIIGQGSFGRVYKATRRNPSSKHSSLPPVMAVKSAEVSASYSIQKEKEILRNLKGCSNIITCFGEDTTTGANGAMAFNLLLEYGSGGNLYDRIKHSTGNKLPEFEARVYTRSILRGLKHVHGNGYVHCDLKPDNIFLVPNCGGGGFRAKIGDFGLAKRGKQTKKRKLEPYWNGTLMYLSPEAVIDGVQEASCDVWAVGCIVVQMLTGKALFDGKKAEEMLRKIGAGEELVKITNEVSKQARDFLKCCFVRNPMYRWTCEMLLTHPFVEGLDDDDDDVVDEFALNEIESIALVYESDGDGDGDGELSCDEWSEDDWDDEFSCWSEEDGDDMDDEVVSDVAADKSYEVTEISKNISSKRHCAVSFSIAAGM